MLRNEDYRFTGEHCRGGLTDWEVILVVLILFKDLFFYKVLVPVVCMDCRASKVILIVTGPIHYHGEDEHHYESYK